MPVEEKPKLHPYAHLAMQAILIVLFAGIVLAILGVAAAMVYWAWTA